MGWASQDGPTSKKKKKCDAFLVLNNLFFIVLRAIEIIIIILQATRCQVAVHEAVSITPLRICLASCIVAAIVSAAYS